VATREKAAQKTAEGKTPEADPSAALVEALAEAEAAEKAAAPAEKKAKPAAKKEQAKPKKKITKLSEIDGTVKDGEKIRIGVEQLGGDAKGAIVTRSLTVPKKYFLAKPGKGNLVHVIDEEHQGRTICTLPTNWQSGIVRVKNDTAITCEPCARRMIAIKKITQAENDKRLKVMRETADRLVAEAKAKVEVAQKEKAEAKAKADAEAKAAIENVEQPAAKPDPKPQGRRSRRKQRQAVAS
jgi:hypothetical protein